MRAVPPALVAVLIVAATAEVAVAALPVGQARGVRVEQPARGSLTVIFSERAARLYRRIAGREVRVGCWHIGSGGRYDGGGVPVFAPRRGRRLVTGDGVRDWDYCRVWLPARTVRRRGGTARYPRQLIVSIPLSQKGAALLDEQEKAVTLVQLLTAAGQEGWPHLTGPFLAAADAIARSNGVLRTLGSHGWPGAHPLVALAAPDQTPAPGAVGYFSDGAERAAAVALSGSGRRLFVEIGPDEELHTNLTSHLFGRIP